MSKQMISLFCVFCVLVSFKTATSLPVRAAQPTKQYELVAKNVVDVCTNGLGTNLFISQKAGVYRLINLSIKQKNGNLRYWNRVVAEDAKAVFPMNNTLFALNTENKLLFSGADKCMSVFHHKHPKDCKSGKIFVANEVVLEDVKRCWSGEDMFAYVKDNTLFLTGRANLPLGNTKKCYNADTMHSYFKGKGDQIQQVVAGFCNFFVLMKDGSVWAKGDNSEHLIAAKRGNINGFRKIVAKGVRAIAANMKNVVILKQNGSLWIWGETMEKRSGFTENGDPFYVANYTLTPYKIADHVTEFALSDIYNDDFGSSTVIFLNKNHVAYGWGASDGVILSSKVKRGRVDRPVKIKGNIRHIYAERNATFLLDERNRLFWAGSSS